MPYPLPGLRVIAAVLFLVDTRVFVFLILLAVLLTPPIMAAFVAATVQKADPGGSDANGVAAFQATRPLTSAALVAAKLTVTVRSTRAAWLLVVVAVLLALILSDTWPIVLDWARQLSDAIGTPRAVVVALLVLSGLVAATWKRKEDSLVFFVCFVTSWHFVQVPVGFGPAADVTK